jgi:hypothetical protein
MMTTMTMAMAAGKHINGRGRSMAVAQKKFNN